MVLNCTVDVQETCQEDPNFGGAVCKPSTLPECSCQEDGMDIKMADPFDPGSYIKCTNMIVDSLTSCGPNMEFDPVEKQCKEMPVFTACTGIGVEPNLNDCRWYYVCLFPNGMSLAYYQIFIRCKDKQVFSSISKTCEDPADLTQSDACYISIAATPVVGSIIVPVPIPLPVPSVSISSQVSNPTGSTAVAETSTTYTCPIFVILFIFWFPGIVNWMCWA